MLEISKHRFTTADNTDAHVAREINAITLKQFEDLIFATSSNRQPERDKAMLLLAFYHALRLSEIIELEWHQINLEKGYIKLKSPNGITTQPLNKQLSYVLSALRHNSCSIHVFITERGGQFTLSGIEKIFKRLSEKAGLGFSISPELIRTSAGLELARRGFYPIQIRDFMRNKTLSSVSRFAPISKMAEPIDWNQTKRKHR